MHSRREVELRAWRGQPDGDSRPNGSRWLASGLRKGLEDSKDEPGAVDFYYGEMEMQVIGLGPQAVRVVERRVKGEQWRCSSNLAASIAR
jgi:hypothetical protein